MAVRQVYNISCPISKEINHDGQTGLYLVLFQRRLIMTVRQVYILSYFKGDVPWRSDKFISGPVSKEIFLGGKRGLHPL